MGRVKTIHHSDWRGGFLFVGNHLTLDFINTCPVQNAEPMELLADFNALLRWFEASKVLSSRDVANLGRHWGKSVRGKEVVENMRKFRERLRKQVVAWEHGGTVHRTVLNELNRLMAEHPMLTRLKVSGSSCSTELWFAPRQPESLFAPLAHSAARLFANVDRKRVRKCGHCVLHFYDTSKKGNRRWCSMQQCGNRLKVAAYAARQRIPSQK